MSFYLSQFTWGQVFETVLTDAIAANNLYGALEPFKRGNHASETYDN